jgi:hypothetical protein
MDSEEEEEDSMDRAAVQSERICSAASMQWDWSFSRGVDIFFLEI